MIAYMVANAVFSLLAGVFVSKNGYFAPPAIIGCAIGTAGCGLLSTLQVNTPSPKWIGFEILISAGLGMAIQQGFTAVQTVLHLDEIPVGTAAVVASQSLGGAVFVSVGNSILQNELLHASDDMRLLGIDIQHVINAGATQFRSFVPESALPTLLAVYNSALEKVFIAAIPMAGLAFFAALSLEWKSVVEKKPNLEAQESEMTPGTREAQENRLTLDALECKATLASYKSLSSQRAIPTKQTHMIGWYI